MKKSILSIKASHVNSGTSISRKELPVPETKGRVFRHPTLHLETDHEVTTAYGGLCLALDMVKKLRLDRALKEGLDLLKSYRPFTEADHVLTHAYNLFLGGNCIEDIGNIQGSEAVRRMLGAARIPDPTTAGDFLRRFKKSDIKALDSVLDDAQERVWQRKYGRHKAPLALVDLDSNVHRVYGDKKEGADFSYKGYVAYHPLIISLANTQECLRLVNRPGNVPSAAGAGKQVREIAPRLKKHFRQVVYRGDSAFAQQDLYDACEAHNQFFAFVSKEESNFYGLAEEIAESEWKPFLTRQQRARRERPIPAAKRRKRRPNRRRQLALARQKRDLKLCKQWVTEIPYKPVRSKTTFRLVIRRQLIEEHDQTGRLFDLWRYRYVITNLKDRRATEIIDLTYQRCDQEKVIEQLQNGISAMRMPTGSLLANSAYLGCARLAHNMKSWICQLALTPETVRWSWKRFRMAFVFVAAKVVKGARQIRVRLASAHRFLGDILKAHRRLQT